MSESEHSLPASTTSEQDRRREDRRPTDGPVRVRIPAAESLGKLRDRSSGGLFLDMDGDLEFDVEFEDSGRSVSRRARLVRCQRLSGTRSGWAIEFIGP
ncbi:MAG: PilZ domain-containing protein [Planctomycetota bacterium]